MLVSNRTHKSRPQNCPKHRFERSWKTRQSNLKKEQSFLFKKPVPAKSWDYEKNSKTPDIIYAGSSKRYYFICECGGTTTRELGLLKPNRKIYCRCKNRINWNCYYAIINHQKFLKPYLTPSTSPTSPMPVYLSLYLFYMVNNTGNNIYLIDIHSWTWDSKV